MTRSLRALPQPAPQAPASDEALNPEIRARWKAVVEPRVAEVLHRLDILEQAFANRSRYRGGALDRDCDEIAALIQDRLAGVVEAFRRGQRRPRVQLSD